MFRVRHAEFRYLGIPSLNIHIYLVKVPLLIKNRFFSIPYIITYAPIEGPHRVITKM